MEDQKKLINKKYISVVITAYNAKETISDTIEACLHQNYPNELEIIVVDDGSTDNSADIIKKIPVKYIYQENAGPAKARNTGWKAASGEIICFTDSDCIPEKDWIKKTVEKFTSDAIGGVGGSYDIQNKGSLLAKCIQEEIVQRHRKTHSNVDFLGSFNVSYRKKVLEEVGGFDASFKSASGEDNDLSYKVRKAGYKLIFDSNIRVGHFHTTKLLKYLREQYRHGYWRMKLYRIHPDMTKGDSYAGILDFAQPPLAIAITGILIASLFYKPLIFLTFLLVILLLALQLPGALKAVIINKQYSYLYFLLVCFLRAFARGFGMLKGICRFFVLEALRNGDR